MTKNKIKFDYVRRVSLSSSEWASGSVHIQKREFPVFLWILLSEYFRNRKQQRPFF